jgi:hypothetical protein
VRDLPARSRGYIAVNRSLLDDPYFVPEPFTELHAYLWMVSEAAWQPRTVRCGRALVHLERGQLAFATRFLAVRFGWSEARVRRFLKRLSKRSAGVGGRAGTGSLEPHFFTQNSHNYFFVYRITSAKFVGLGGGQDENLAARARSVGAPKRSR